MNVGIWKGAMYLSPLRTIRRYVVVPMLNKFVECELGLQAVGFPATLIIHQQTDNTEKPYEY